MQQNTLTIGPRKELVTVFTNLFVQEYKTNGRAIYQEMDINFNKYLSIKVHTQFLMPMTAISSSMTLDPQTEIKTLQVFKQQDLLTQRWINHLHEDKQLSHPAGFGRIAASSTGLEVLGLPKKLIKVTKFWSPLANFSNGENKTEHTCSFLTFQIQQIILMEHWNIIQTSARRKPSWQQL